MRCKVIRFPYMLGDKAAAPFFSRPSIQLTSKVSATVRTTTTVATGPPAIGVWLVSQHVPIERSKPSFFQLPAFETGV